MPDASAITAPRQCPDSWSLHCRSVLWRSHEDVQSFSSEIEPPVRFLPSRDRRRGWQQWITAKRVADGTSSVAMGHPAWSSSWSTGADGTAYGCWRSWKPTQPEGSQATSRWIWDEQVGHGRVLTESGLALKPAAAYTADELLHVWTSRVSAQTEARYQHRTPRATNGRNFVSETWYDALR